MAASQMPPSMPVIAAEYSTYLGSPAAPMSVSAAKVSAPPASGKVALGVGDAPGIGVPKPSVKGPLLPVVKGDGADGLKNSGL